MSSINLWRQYNIKFNGYRVVESPNDHIKAIQRKILQFLRDIDIPDYIYSVSGKSTKDALSVHTKTSNHLIITDISKFFMSTGREKVYRFWVDEMNMSSSVANVMTNLTTMDLRKCSLNNIMQFIKDNSLCICHLGTGFPSSSILAYLCNYKMYEELNSYCDDNELTMSVYVDDIIISSHRNVTKNNYNQIKSIISTHGYKLNGRKTKIYNNFKPKKVLGLILSKERVSVPSGIHLQAYTKRILLKINPHNEKIKRSYNGVMNYIKNSSNGNK